MHNHWNFPDTCSFQPARRCAEQGYCGYLAMFKFQHVLPVLALSLFSCGSDPATTQSTTDSVADSTALSVDTLPADTVAAEVIAFRMGGDTIAPAEKNLILYSFNAALLKKQGKVLTAKEVRKRFLPLDPACDNEATFKIQRYFQLDSLKKIGESPESDMGQMIFGEIRLLDSIKKGPDGTWVLWSLKYETEQACPYASGTLFMLSTYDATGKNISTQCMAREEGGADAPISWNTHEVCNIFTDGSYRSLVSDTTEDYDEHDKPVYSVMRKTYTGQISAGGKITRKEEEIERTE